MIRKGREASETPKDRGHELLQDLQLEWERLNQELTRMRNERDQLARVIAALTWEGCTLTKEEILAQIGKEKPLRELLDELRQNAEN